MKLSLAFKNQCYTTTTKRHTHHHHLLKMAYQLVLLLMYNPTITEKQTKSLSTTSLIDHGSDAQECNQKATISLFNFTPVLLYSNTCFEQKLQIFLQKDKI
jgi:hypothetical protein